MSKDKRKQLQIRVRKRKGEAGFEMWLWSGGIVTSFSLGKHDVAESVDSLIAKVTSFIKDELS